MANVLLAEEPALKGSNSPGKVLSALISEGIDQLEDEELLTTDTAVFLRAVNLTRSRAKTMVHVTLATRQWAAVAFLRQTLEEASGETLSDTDIVRALAHLTVSEVHNARPAVH